MKKFSSRVTIDIILGLLLFMTFSVLELVTDGFGLYSKTSGFGWPFGFLTVGMVGLSSGGFAWVVFLLDLAICICLIHFGRWWVRRHRGRPSL